MEALRIAANAVAGVTRESLAGYPGQQQYRYNEQDTQSFIVDYRPSIDKRGIFCVVTPTMLSIPCVFVAGR